MKRLIRAILPFALVLFGAACSESEQNESSSEPDASVVPNEPANWSTSSWDEVRWR